MKTERLTAEEVRIKCRQILVDYHRRDDYDLSTAEGDLAFTMQAFAAQEVAAIEMPTREEIVEWANNSEKIEDFMPFTLQTHIRKKIESRIEGAEYFRSRMEGNK